MLEIKQINKLIFGPSSTFSEPNWKLSRKKMFSKLFGEKPPAKTCKQSSTSVLELALIDLT